MASEEPGPGQMCALQARKHIVALRRARPDVSVEIRSAHKDVPGKEEADEWVELAAEEPDARGVEWLGHSDRTEAQPMPLPRSLAHLKRVISEKWAEARQWGWRPGLQEEIQASEQAEAGCDGGR